MEFDRPQKRERHAFKLGKELKKFLVEAGGVCEKVHGNQFQSGWPSHFHFHRAYGTRWLQVLGPRGKLTPAKEARFRYWSDHGVSILVLRRLSDAQLLPAGVSNWLGIDVSRLRECDVRDNYHRRGYTEPLTPNALERDIARAIGTKLKGWMFEKTWGSKFQAGWPDYYAHHPKHGERWIETKRPGGKLEATQYAKFKRWSAAGVRIWVLDSVDSIPLLFEEPNWHKWPRKRWRLKGML